MRIIKTVFWLSFLILIDQLIKGWARSGPFFVINKQYLLGQYIFDPFVVMSEALYTCIILGFVLILVWLGKKKLDQDMPGFILIITGALSNLIDRLYWGGVVDFITFQIANFKLFFNLADIFVILGLILYVTKAKKSFN